jgi:hypothetical protein
MWWQTRNNWICFSRSVKPTPQPSPTGSGTKNKQVSFTIVACLPSNNARAPVPSFGLSRSPVRRAGGIARSPERRVQPRPGAVLGLRRRSPWLRSLGGRRCPDDRRAPPGCPVEAIRRRANAVGLFRVKPPAPPTVLPGCEMFCFVPQCVTCLALRRVAGEA